MAMVFSISGLLKKPQCGKIAKLKSQIKMNNIKHANATRLIQSLKIFVRLGFKKKLFKPKSQAGDKGTNVNV